MHDLYANPTTTWTEGQSIKTADGKEAFWNGKTWKEGKQKAPPNLTFDGIAERLTTDQPDVEYEIDWGDGTAKDTRVITAAGVTHDYASPGHFTVKATNLETGQGGTV